MLDNVLVTTGLPIVAALIMWGIGLTLRVEDFRRVAGRPRSLIIGVAGHYLLLPLLGFAFAGSFAASPGYAVGFVLLAACPSANVSNVLAFLARGNTALAVSLAVICAFVTLLSVPLLVNFALDWFGGADARWVRLPLRQTMTHLALLLLAPVMLGMLVRRLAPGFALRAEPWIGRLSLLFLLVLAVVITLGNADLAKDAIRRLGLPTLLMCTLGIAGGLLLARAFRLPIADAITIGMEVGVQNCMLAMLVALTLLRMPEVAMPAAVYGLTMFLPAFALVAFGRRHFRMPATS